MFWVYAIALLLPPIFLHRFLSRQADESDDGVGVIVATIVVFVLQAVLLIVGGWIATTIAVLVFGYACLLAYAMWGADGKDEHLTQVKPTVQGIGFQRADQTPEPIVTGRNLDLIRFDYLNQQGEFSSRRIKVTMVGAWNFKGIDLDKHAERTFRYERVIGDITSEKTGEVLEPEDWADSMVIFSPHPE